MWRAVLISHQDDACRFLPGRTLKHQIIWPNKSSSFSASVVLCSTCFQISDLSFLIPFFIFLNLCFSPLKEDGLLLSLPVSVKSSLHLSSPTPSLFISLKVPVFPLLLSTLLFCGLFHLPSDHLSPSLPGRSIVLIYDLITWLIEVLVTATQFGGGEVYLVAYTIYVKVMVHVIVHRISCLCAQCGSQAKVQLLLKHISDF